MQQKSSRRRFVGAALAAGALSAIAQQTESVRGFDHVALPVQNAGAMLAFYRSLGFDVKEGPNACSVYIGGQMINFHRPALWQSEKFTLRAPAAKPPCGDLCFIWDGTPQALKAMLDHAGADIIEGPVPRQGGRKSNLLEFMIYS